MPVIQDKALREQYKERWTRPPSETLTTTLWERIAGYRANLQQAAASDAKVALPWRLHGQCQRFLHGSCPDG